MPLKRAHVGWTFGLATGLLSASVLWADEGSNGSTEVVSQPPGSSWNGLRDDIVNSLWKRRFRSGMMVSYRHMYDVAVYGWGPYLSISPLAKWEPRGFHASLEILPVFGKTGTGLNVDEVEIGSMCEWGFRSGVRLGVGAGVSFLEYPRATTGGSWWSLAPGATVRIGLDLGLRPYAFIVADLNAELAGFLWINSVIVWGPRIGVGVGL